MRLTNTKSLRFKLSIFIFLFIARLNVSSAQDTLIIQVNSLTENLIVYKDSSNIEKIGSIPRNRPIYLIGPAGRFNFLVYGNGLLGYANKIMLEYDKRSVLRLTNTSIDDKVKKAKILEEADLKELQRNHREDSIRSMLETKRALEKGLKDILQVVSFNMNMDSYKVDFNITIANYNKKSIKYVRFTIAGYNDVGDIEQTKIFKGVGPIGFISFATYEFEDAFYSKVITKLKLLKVSIEYMDGSKKEFLGNKLDLSIAIPEE